MNNNTVNQFRLSYTRMMAARAITQRKPRELWFSFAEQIPNGTIYSAAGEAGCSDLNVSGFFQQPTPSRSGRGHQRLCVRDVYNRTISKHTLNIGGEANLENDRRRPR